MDSPPNLLYLQPIPETELEQEQSFKLTPLPSMESLRRSCSDPTEPCEFYLVLQPSPELPEDDFRPRRDSGGFSFRSSSSSPGSSSSPLSSNLSGSSSNLSSGELELELEYLDHRLEQEKVPQSPTDLEPTIHQLFRRSGPAEQDIQATEQFIILDDIHQIIGGSEHTGI